MYLDEYQKITIEEFNGFYSRGSIDEVPSDHASQLVNIQFGKMREVSTRPGVGLTKSMSNYPIVRMFLCTSSVISELLTCDGAGHLYLNDTLVLTVANMVDFAAINMFNRSYIMPILSTYSATNKIYVRDVPNDLFYPAAGYAPNTSFNVTEPGSGNIGIGIHKFAVSFVTSTGFTTQPGPKLSGTFTPISLNASGGKNAYLDTIPIGPTGTVGRIILATKAGLNDFYYIPGGTINDNSATTLTVDFSDTDLAVSAEDLFDLREFIPASAAGFGGASLGKYRGRLLVLNGSDTVLVSDVNNADAFSTVTGYIQIPTENDGNVARAWAELYGVLYLTKAVGIYSTQDNFGNPSTWPVNQVDGGIGTYQGGMGSITGSQPNLSMNAVVLMANREGVFIFNGSVQRPQLTWKIQDYWDSITHGYEGEITIAVDAFKDLIYVLIPSGGSTTPLILLVGDYSRGLDYKNIRWCQYTFPWVPRTISMMNIQNEGSDSDFDYHLRITSGYNIYSLAAMYTSDLGTPINASYTTGPIAPSKGSINIYRAMKVRARGTSGGNLVVGLLGEAAAEGGPAFTIPLTPNSSVDRVLSCAWENEKGMVSFGMNTLNKSFTVSRIDIFCKEKWGCRPA